MRLGIVAGIIAAVALGGGACAPAEGDASASQPAAPLVDTAPPSQHAAPAIARSAPVPPVVAAPPLAPAAASSGLEAVTLGPGRGFLGGRATLDAGRDARRAWPFGGFLAPWSAMKPGSDGRP